MSRLLYRLMNPPVAWLLESRIHRLMSGNTLLLEFRGRTSGRALRTPISYHAADGAAHCFTSRSFVWWRNLRGSPLVHVTVQGRRIATRALVEADDLDTKVAALHRFLVAVPRDASHAGVALDRAGRPDQGDLRRVAPDMVYLTFPLGPVELE